MVCRKNKIFQFLGHIRAIGYLRETFAGQSRHGRVRKNSYSGISIDERFDKKKKIVLLENVRGLVVNHGLGTNTSFAMPHTCRRAVLGGLAQSGRGMTDTLYTRSVACTRCTTRRRTEYDLYVRYRRARTYVISTVRPFALLYDFVLYCVY